MSFDNIPEDKQESHPCPFCGGAVVSNGQLWECTACSFSTALKQPTIDEVKLHTFGSARHLTVEEKQFISKLFKE